MVRRVLSLLLALVLLSTCSGCTFVGLAVGASIPKRVTYGLDEPIDRELARATRREELEVGDNVDVFTRRTPPGPTASPESTESLEIGAPPPAPLVVPVPVARLPRVVSGRFHSFEPGVLRVDGDDYFAEVPVERIDRVRVSRGSHWLAGMLIGFGVDSVCAAVATAVIVNGLGQLR